MVLIGFFLSVKVFLLDVGSSDRHQALGSFAVAHVLEWIVLPECSHCKALCKHGHVVIEAFPFFVFSVSLVLVFVDAPAPAPAFGLGRPSCFVLFFEFLDCVYSRSVGGVG